MRFLLVGGTTAVVQFALLAIVRGWLPADLAFSSAFLGATAVHYTLNRFWALPSERRDSWRQLIEYVLTAGVSYLVNIALFKLGHDVLSLSVMWSAVLAVPPAILIVFIILNYRVFRRHKS